MPDPQLRRPIKWNPQLVYERVVNVRKKRYMSMEPRGLVAKRRERLHSLYPTTSIPRAMPGDYTRMRITRVSLVSSALLLGLCNESVGCVRSRMILHMLTIDRDSYKSRTDLVLTTKLLASYQGPFFLQTPLNECLVQRSHRSPSLGLDGHPHVDRGHQVVCRARRRRGQPRVLARGGRHGRPVGPSEDE